MVWAPYNQVSLSIRKPAYLNYSLSTKLVWTFILRKIEWWKISLSQKTIEEDQHYSN